MAVRMSNISNKRLDAEYKSKGAALVSWSMEQAERATRICIYMLRKSIMILQVFPLTQELAAPIPRTYRKPKNFAKTCSLTLENSMKNSRHVALPYAVMATELQAQATAVKVGTVTDSLL